MTFDEVVPVEEVKTPCQVEGDTDFMCPGGASRFDFKGQQDGVYAMLSTPELHVNMLTKKGEHGLEAESFITALAFLSADGHQAKISLVNDPVDGKLSPWTDGELHASVGNVHVQVDGVNILNVPSSHDIEEELGMEELGLLADAGMAVTHWGEPGVLTDTQGSEEVRRLEGLSFYEGAVAVKYDAYSPQAGYAHNLTLTIGGSVFAVGVARAEYRLDGAGRSDAGMDYLEVTQISGDAVRAEGEANEIIATPAKSRKLLAMGLVPPDAKKKRPAAGGVFGHYCGPIEKRTPEPAADFLVGTGGYELHKMSCAKCVKLEPKLDAQRPVVKKQMVIIAHNALDAAAAVAAAAADDPASLGDAAAPAVANNVEPLPLYGRTRSLLSTCS